MNKYVIIGVVLVAIIGGGVLLSTRNNAGNCTPEMGAEKVINVTSKRLEWRFEPEVITVEKCDRVTLNVSNEDNFDHGVAIDALGISQRLPANGKITINFVAVKTGEFPFYCSVSCSDSKSTGNLKDGVVQTGPYAGTFRGHFEHIGKFIVTELKALVN